MPLTSRSRRIARPPITWPLASMMRPASVVTVMAKLTPRARNASTACSMARAASASSQLAKASTLASAGLTSVRGPRHQNLRLGEKQRVGAVDCGLGGDGLVARRRLDLGQAPARAHEQDRGDDGEAENAERER